MINGYNNTVYTQRSLDVGLRSYMIGVYNHMVVALLVTSFTAYFTVYSGLLHAILSVPGLIWVIILSPAAISITMGIRIQRFSVSTVYALCGLYSVLMGLSLSTFVAIYTDESIFKVFLMAAIIFGTMSLYGYTTKRDLTSMGSFLGMGVLSMIVVSLLNLLIFNSGVIGLFVSAVMCVLAIGLTAYDTQNIRDTYYAMSNNKEEAHKFAVYGAFRLYIDFIVIFINLLRFLGERR